MKRVVLTLRVLVVMLFLGFIGTGGGLQAQSITQSLDFTGQVHGLDHARCGFPHLDQQPETKADQQAYKDWVSAGRPAQPTIHQIKTVGDTKNFWVYNFVTASYDNVSFTLRATGALANVWVADSEFDNEKVNDEVVTAMLTALEDETPANSWDPAQGVIAIDQAVFGAPPNADGDGLLDVLVTDIKDGYDPETGGGYTAGFFTPADLNFGNANSNKADIIYVDSYPGIYSEDNETNAQRPLSTVVHEYQHLIHANYGNLSTSQNEGQSEYAEIVAGYPARNMSYLDDPEAFGRWLYSWAGNGSAVLDDYQRVGLFHSYIAERTSVLAAGGITRANAGYRTAYEEALNTQNLNWEDVLTEFHVANRVSDVSIDSRFGYTTATLQQTKSKQSTNRYTNGVSTATTTNSVNYAGVNYTEWRGVQDLNLTILGDAGIRFYTVSKPLSAGGAIVSEQTAGTFQVDGTMESVTLIAVNTLAGGSEQTISNRDFTFSASWSAAPIVQETINYAQTAAFFTLLLGEESGTSGEKVSAYAVMLAPSIDGSVRTADFIINNRATGLEGTGELKFVLSESIQVGGTGSNANWIPGTRIDSVNVDFSSLSIGSNSIDLSGTDLPVVADKNYHLIITTENASDDARIELLIDDGIADTTNTDYWPVRTRLILGDFGPSSTSWLRFGGEDGEPQNNNVLFSFDLSGFYSGQLVVPTITSQPADIDVIEGAEATLTVAATGEPDAFFYQWYKDGEAVSGATLETQTFAPITLADEGVWTVEISNLAGAVTSVEATVVVQPSQFGISTVLPNQVSTTAEVTFDLDVPATVYLYIYDVQGRQVLEIDQGARQSGRRTVTFDVSNLAAGVYFVNLQAKTESNLQADTQRIVVLR